MKVWYCNLLDSRRSVSDVPKDRIRLGRSTDSDIVLQSPYIADRAAVLTRTGDEWTLHSLGKNGCSVNGVRVACGESRVISADATIEIFPFGISLQSPPIAVDQEQNRHTEIVEQVSELIRAVHVDLLEAMEIVDSPSGETLTDEYLLCLEQNIDHIAKKHGLNRSADDSVTARIAGECIRSYLVALLLEPAGDQTISGKHEPWSRLVSAAPHLEHELQCFVQLVASSLKLKATSSMSRQLAQIEAHYWEVWDKASSEMFRDFRAYLAHRQVKKQIKDTVFGFGPLEDLLRIPEISEIMVVSSDRIYIEKNGVVENSGRRFVSDDVTQTIIERIVARVGRQIDKSRPLVDARLPDGSRVNAVIPPLAIGGPCLTIRKFPDRRMTMDDLLRVGAVTQPVAEFLRACVVQRRNILISGGTGSGKTTLLNCLSEYIPDKDRIVTIEDTAELQLHKDHVVRMEAKPANPEGVGEYSINDLVRNALRMRPDRIVVGECRGKEALAMLQAMNTGHDGSLTTLHANSAEDAVLRLEVMVQDAADMPMTSIQRQIVSALDIVVQLTRHRDGRRLVSQVVEVAGVCPRGSGIRIRELFALRGYGQDAELHPTGALPSFLDVLEETGLINLELLYC